MAWGILTWHEDGVCPSQAIHQMAEKPANIWHFGSHFPQMQLVLLHFTLHCLKLYTSRIPPGTFSVILHQAETFPVQHTGIVAKSKNTTIQRATGKITIVFCSLSSCDYRAEPHKPTRVVCACKVCMLIPWKLGWASWALWWLSKCNNGHSVSHLPWIKWTVNDRKI